MVQETRIIFDLSDLSVVRLVCALGDCDGEVILRLVGIQQTDTIVKTPLQCPRCGREWQLGQRAEAANRLLRAIQAAMDWPSPSVKIRFEIPVQSD